MCLVPIGESIIISLWEGYNYCEVQDKVDEFLGKNQKKSIDEIAKEVIKVLWGNGTERKKRLEEAGYSYTEVQRRVNQLA